MTFHTTLEYTFFRKTNLGDKGDTLVLVSEIIGKIVWEYDLPLAFTWIHRFLGKEKKRVPSILNIIGVFKNNVWLSLDSGRILAIDIEKGELAYNIFQPNYYPSGFNILKEDGGSPFGRFTQIDTDNGLLFGLNSSFYWEIDLNMPDESFIVYDTEEGCSKFNIIPMSGSMGYHKAWYRSEIYFGNIGDINSETNTIGLFDRNCKEIVWSEKVNELKRFYPAIKQIKYLDNRLFVLDGGQTLHVYQIDR